MVQLRREEKSHTKARRNRYMAEQAQQKGSSQPHPNTVFTYPLCPNHAPCRSKYCMLTSSATNLAEDLFELLGIWLLHAEEMLHLHTPTARTSLIISTYMHDLAPHICDFIVHQSPSLYHACFTMAPTWSTFLYEYVASIAHSCYAHLPHTH